MWFLTGTAMVCSRGESPTTPNIQMKFFSTIVACAAVIGASLTAVTPAFAGYYNFNSNRIGGATYTNGYGSNGYSFNGSSRRIGGATYFNGSDSYGNSYNGNCRRIGSFTNCSMY